MAAYKRIILKLSGETLAPENKSGSFDASRVDRAAEAIIKLHDMGVQVALCWAAATSGAAAFPMR